MSNYIGEGIARAVVVAFAWIFLGGIALGLLSAWLAMSGVPRLWQLVKPWIHGWTG